MPDVKPNCKHGLVDEHCGMCHPIAKDYTFSMTNFHRLHHHFERYEKLS